MVRVEFTKALALRSQIPTRFNGGVEGNRVWMACGAVLVRVVAFS